MSYDKTGGPAFAQYILEPNPAGGEPRIVWQEGMTLRDYFAAKAMQALITCGKYNGIVGVNNYEINRAKDAYAVADALLKARQP